ncbi:MAG: hypothetical protein MPJ04_08820, partial [Nitrosopumilus sp.]|nr:hypothetical protein [Nitrosopumilus sp.]
GRLDEALECAERSLKIRPGNFVAAGFRARILAGLGRDEEALGCADGCTHFEDHHFIAARGLALAGLGDHAKAMAYLEVAADIDANPQEFEDARQAVIEAAGIEVPARGR